MISPKPTSWACATPSSIDPNVRPSKRSGVCTLCPASRSSSAKARKPVVWPIAWWKRSTSAISPPSLVVGRVPPEPSERRRYGVAMNLDVLPANESSWEDLQAVFGTRGDPSRCWCQRFRMLPGESWASVGAEELAFRLRQQTDCGHPASDSTSGLVAYLDREPVGWCAIAPRSAHPRLLRNNRVPWEGRAEDRLDDSIWAVTCFVTRAGFRRRGISYALARAAIPFAR